MLQPEPKIPPAATPSTNLKLVFLHKLHKKYPSHISCFTKGKKEMEHGEINYIHFFSQAQNRLAEHSNLLILNVPMQISSLE